MSIRIRLWFQFWYLALLCTSYQQIKCNWFFHNISTLCQRLKNNTWITAIMLILFCSCDDDPCQLKLAILIFLSENWIHAWHFMYGPAEVSNSISPMKIQSFRNISNIIYVCLILHEINIYFFLTLRLVLNGLQKTNLYWFVSKSSIYKSFLKHFLWIKWINETHLILLIRFIFK